MGVLGAIFVAWFRNAFSWNLLQVALAGTMSTVGTIIWLILGAVAFVGIYNLIGGADFMRSLFSGLGLPAIGIVFVMMGILVILGTFMEWIAIAFITVPVFAPVVVGMAPELGLEPEWAAVWFGVLFVMNIQIYFLSPPFGPACFWLKSVAPADITLQEIFLSVLPFIALQIIGMLLVLAFIFLSYGRFGLYANIALTLNLVFIVGVLSLIQATLTLPGIAGIVLTIGMAVDALSLIHI